MGSAPLARVHADAGSELNEGAADVLAAGVSIVGDFPIVAKGERPDCWE